MEYEWDPRKAATNLQKHRISFADAVSVFADESTLTMLKPTADEERFITLGMDAFGHVLVVVCTWRGPQRIRLISARNAPRACTV